MSDTPMKWDLQTVADAVSGRPAGGATITSVVTDSRIARPGALFVALSGDRFDGNDFIEAALANGAAAALAATGRLPEGAPGVEVPDTIDALRALAIRRRAELGVTVVAITGSSGKTTTKDLLMAALGDGAHGSPRSFNNEIGVPLTVLGTPDDATYLVVEVGSRGPGHIAWLAPCVRPDVAVITNVGRAHLETFGSEEGVLAAKWEIVEALAGNGAAVLPAADDRLVNRRSGRTITFGADRRADVRVEDVIMDTQGRAQCRLRYGDKAMSLRLPVAGVHQPENAAAAVAAAIAVGARFEPSVSGIERADVSAWRMEVAEGRLTIVNDAYNANPDSMEAALSTVAGMPGRHFAVLGKMHELGGTEQAAHRAVGARAVELGFTMVVVVGDDPGIAAGAGSIAVPADTPEEAAAIIGSAAAEGDVVLVKASRAAGLERAAHMLRESAP